MKRLKKTIVFLLSLCFSVCLFGAITVNAENNSFIVNANETKEIVSYTNVNADNGFSLKFNVSGMSNGGVTEQNDIDKDKSYAVISLKQDDFGFDFYFAPNDNDIYKTLGVLYYADGSSQIRAHENETKEEYWPQTNPVIFSEGNGEHLISFKKDGDFWFVIFDGIVFRPLAGYSQKSLSNANVTVTGVNKSTESVTFSAFEKLDTVQTYRFENFSTLGGSNITKLEDGAVKFEVTDRSDEYYEEYHDYHHAFFRERIGNFEGISVEQPISFEYHFNYLNSPTVWLGLVLSTNNFAYDLGCNADEKNYMTMARYDCKFENTFDLTINDNEDALSVIKEVYDIAVPNYEYLGYNTVNTVTYIVKEDKTEMYMNGAYVYDIPVKKADFKDGKAYVSFRFMSITESDRRNQVLTVRPVSAPFVNNQYREVLSYRNTEKDLQLLADIRSTQFKIYRGNEEIPNTAYSYDIENKVLKLNFIGYLDTLQAGEYTYTVETQFGKDTFLHIYEDVERRAPTCANDSITFDQNKIETDATFVINLENCDFVSFTGNKITQADYEITEENGKVTLVLKKEYLQKLAPTVYNYNFKTQGGTKRISVKIKEAQTPITNSGNGGSLSVGAIIGIAVGAVAVVGAATVASVFIIKRRKKK